MINREQRDLLEKYLERLVSDIEFFESKIRQLESSIHYYQTKIQNAEVEQSRVKITMETATSNGADLTDDFKTAKVMYDAENR